MDLRCSPRRRRAGLAAGVLVLLLAGVSWLRLGPIPSSLLEEDPRESTLIVDRNGVPLYEALSSDGTRARSIAADAIPPLLAAATVAVEDRRFFSHPGVDPVAIVRALKTNLAERRVVEGGSTISQQVAKLLLNRRDPRRRRGFLTKIDEAVLALRLEHHFTKQDLLARYLNLASYGRQIVGVERASRAYFGVPAAMLTPAQAALLAGLPQQPSRFDPHRDRTAALLRQRSVLGRMAASGMLSNEELQRALAERLAFTHEPAPFRSRHFVEMVLRTSGDRRSSRIETTLDSGLQEDVAGIIRSHRDVLKRHGAANVAVVVLANGTAEWLAWEGSGDYGDAASSGAIDGVLTPRQPGSALKPFTYALAFERGFSPASVLADLPSHFPTAEPGVVYAPRNYDGKYRGPLLARTALAGSQNVPAVALAVDLGVPDLLRFLSRAGLTTFEKNAAYYGLGVTLGNAEVRLAELVAAYAAFARGGEWLEPTYVREPAGKRDRRTLVSPRTAFWISDVLSDPHAREYVFGRGGSLEFPFPVAVKTGTSQAYHDNWTIGFSRDVTVGVWVGNFNRAPLRNSSGVTGAAPIFHGVMLAATRRLGPAIEAAGHPIVPAPANVRAAEICALSGLSANPWCPAKHREWMPAEAPLAQCSWHHLADEGPLLVWPPEYRAWAEEHGHETTPHPAPPSIAAGMAAAPVPFRIANPADGATYLIDPTLRREFQAVPLRAVTHDDDPVEWRVNGALVGTQVGNQALSWPLAPGRHHVVARNAAGHLATATITVR